MDLMALTSVSIATGLLATSAARMATGTIRACATNLRQRSARIQVQSELTRATEHVRLASRLQRPVQIAPTGGWQVMEVVETKRESADCLSIYLQDPLHRERLADFKPGQFLLVRPALGGSTLPSRCYSLSDCPGQPYWRLTIKRQSSPRVSSKSLSGWIHDFLQPGDCLLVSGPHGHFTIDPAAKDPLVLLAAGVGITPILSMLKSCLAAGSQRSITLLYQVTDDDHWPFGQTVHRWCDQFGHLRVISYMSRQNQLPHVPAGEVRAGKFQPDDILQHWSPEAHVLMCGPQTWMDAITSDLAAQGVPREHLHSESFASADSPSVDKSLETTSPWSIEFTRSGLITPESQAVSTLWQAAKDSGLTLPAGCHSGACGSCKLKLISGQVTYRQAPTCQHGAEEVVACVAQPVGHIMVDA